MNGNGRVVFIAWRDDGLEMQPVAADGRLVLFPTLGEAKMASGPLGVGSPTRRTRIPEMCQRWGLGIPVTNGDYDEPERT